MQKVETVDDLEIGIPAEQNGNEKFFTNEIEVVNDINQLTKKNNVVVFSLSSCPFCIELKRSLGI